MKYVVRVPGGLHRWLENDAARIRREIRHDARIRLPDRRNDELVIETNGSVQEAIAGLCRAWAGTNENPLECVREFIRSVCVRSISGKPSR